MAIRRPARILGIDIGRSNIACGALVTDVPLHFGLPGQSVFGEAENSSASIRSRDFYQRLVTQMKQVANRFDYLDGIGVGLPGVVDAGGGSIVASPGGLDAQELFVENLAGHIADDGLLRRLMVVDREYSSEALCNEIASKIFIDNDANCAARGLLNRHRHDVQWQNFACVLIGTGVGAGLVFNREVYYGSSGAAGEIGHTIVTMDGTLDGTVWEATRDKASSGLEPCGCTADAGHVHWESVVSGGALVVMLKRMAPRLYEQLRMGQGREPGAQDLGYLARAGMYGQGGDQEWETYRRIIRDAELNDEYRRVMHTHASLVACGLANLVNLLNLDHVVVSGGVMDGLMSAPEYRDQLNASVRSRLLETSTSHFSRVSFDSIKRQRHAAWQGAALLFTDTGYLQRLAVEASMEGSVVIPEPSNA